MTVYRPVEYKERTEQFLSFRIHIVSYKIDNLYYCSVDDFDPGAIIARSNGPTREEAENKAITRAKERLESSYKRENKFSV